MNDMLNSLEGFDSGSNYKFGDKMDKGRPPRSLFDLSHLNTLTMDNAGKLVPIALWETLPGDDFDINVDCLLRVMPQVVPLYSRQRLYVYGFYMRNSDAWNHWQVFIGKGYTGNVNKAIPILHTESENNSANVAYSSETVEGVTTYEKVKPNSLFDYIGLPIGADCDNLFNASSNAGISALPFMMYLRIYRDYFMNKNEWINDRVMLPDDDSRFRLDDNGHLLSALDESKTISFSQNNDITITGDNYDIGLLYHDYPDDYFTSALPFTQRGSTPTISQTSILKGGVVSNGISYNDNITVKQYFSSLGIQIDDNDLVGLQTGTNPNGVGDLLLNKGSEKIGSLYSADTKYYQVVPYIDTKIAIEQLRELAIKQIELEKMARTDGSYKQFGLTFFGESSKAAYDFRPTYIGGTYKNIVFTEVLQTAGSTVPTTAESGNSPLGAYSGHGITGISNGRIGHVHADDYGMVMLIACIMPDVYYSQGLERILTDSLESDKYKPERARLGMQPILNREIYYAGNNGNAQGEDLYLWAYQNPFDWLRYMPNKIHGKIADSTNKSFFPYTQSRKFDSLPNWGRNFSEAKDIRKDYLYAPIEDAYSAQFSINIRAVREIPYKANPAQIIN